MTLKEFATLAVVVGGGYVVFMSIVPGIVAWILGA